MKSVFLPHVPHPPAASADGHLTDNFLHLSRFELAVHDGSATTERLLRLIEAADEPVVAHLAFVDGETGGAPIKDLEVLPVSITYAVVYAPRDGLTLYYGTRRDSRVNRNSNGGSIYLPGAGINLRWKHTGADAVALDSSAPVSGKLWRNRSVASREHTKKATESNNPLRDNLWHACRITVFDAEILVLGPGRDHTTYVLSDGRITKK